MAAAQPPTLLCPLGSRLRRYADIIKRGSRAGMTVRVPDRYFSLRALLAPAGRALQARTQPSLPSTCLLAAHRRRRHGPGSNQRPLEAEGWLECAPRAEGSSGPEEGQAIHRTQEGRSGETGSHAQGVSLFLLVLLALSRRERGLRRVMADPDATGTECKNQQEHRAAGRCRRVLRKADDHEERSDGRVSVPKATQIPACSTSPTFPVHMIELRRKSRRPNPPRRRNPVIPVYSPRHLPYAPSSTSHSSYPSATLTFLPKLSISTLHAHLILRIIYSTRVLPPLTPR